MIESMSLPAGVGSKAKVGNRKATMVAVSMR